MRCFGAILRQGFIVVSTGGVGIEAEVELVFPAELESSLAEGVVAVLRTGMTFRKVGRMGCEFVGNDTCLHIVLVWQAKVLFGGHITKHRAAIPTDHRGTDAGGDVVIARCDVGGERSKRVEGGFMAPLELLCHVFFDHVHRHMAGAFVHHLAAFGPRAFGELALHFKLAELRLVIGISNRSGTKPVADRE